MKFVGGEWHGLDIPSEAITFRRIGCFEVCQMINMVSGRSTSYALSWWWQGPGKPLLPYFVATVLTQDQVVPMMREVLRAD